MEYDEKHMDTARRLARHAAEREWLRAAYETLGRQKLVAEALTAARACMHTSGNGELARLNALRDVVARVLVAQCESILRHSGMDAEELAEIATAPSGDQAEGREETLPW